ncbi:MAG: hypothetical protein FWH40_06905 [Coriobacteriia bacterium]|nr:hypothetical protein [Coriobacteriia bacterium]
MKFIKEPVVKSSAGFCFCCIPLNKKVYGGKNTCPGCSQDCHVYTVNTITTTKPGNNGVNNNGNGNGNNGVIFPIN